MKPRCAVAMLFRTKKRYRSSLPESEEKKKSKRKKRKEKAVGCYGCYKSDKRTSKHFGGVDMLEDLIVINNKSKQ